MPASFKWTSSTPIGLKDYDQALQTFLGDLYQIGTPGPWLFVHDSGGEIRVYNDDWGLIIDDQDEDMFSSEEKTLWDNYMSTALARADWRDAVVDGEGIKVTTEELARLVKLSLELEIMKAPLELCIDQPGKYRVRLRGDTDGEACPYNWDEASFLDLVSNEDRYCIQSIATPSNDVDYFYMFVSFYRGSLELKSYRIKASGIDFSHEKLRDAWELVENLFNGIQDPEALLKEFTDTAAVATLRDFIDKINKMSRDLFKSGQFLCEYS